MARKAKTGKLTRRDAVAMLGAGTVLGVARTPPSMGEGAQGDHCDEGVAKVGTYKTSNALALVSFSCCVETKNALLVGVKEPGETPVPTQRGKKHLQPLKVRLNNDHLLEYCFMIWGITGEQALRLFAEIPKQVGLQVDKRDGPAAK